jgi:hypothetical protein
VKNKLKRKRSVIEIKDDEAIEVGIDELSVKPLSPMVCLEVLRQILFE